MKHAVLLAALGLSACAHAPIELTGCNLPMTRLAVPEPEPGAAISEGVMAPPASPYEALVAGALALPTTEAPGAPPPTRPVSLFLSGGSQNGAFGAGFIERWRIGNGGRLPAFRVVTGISTGALIGTTVFTGESHRAVAGYTIDSEADLLDVKARGLVNQVKAGAVGSLDPLRRRIDNLLDKQPGDDALLADIAEANDRDGRKFIIGVADVREGEAYAVDMTALASRWAAEPDAAKRTRIKQCYIEALVASSSVPFAAPPVYVDGHMLVDGGVRFGVFRSAEQAGFARAVASTRPADKALAPASFLIVNGKWEIEPQCPYEPAADGSCPASGKLRKWDILDLGFRSIDILTNQIYRFSADAATQGPGDHAFARIEADAPGHVFNGKTCAEWRTIDNADKPPPVQFHKREMLCLIDYGDSRSLVAEWWKRD
jgi:predicted patatin/cPLA2 family phospholipase